MDITGLEANELLYIIDAHCQTNIQGRIQKGWRGTGLTRAHWQDLRDRLFEAHEHPREVHA